eukprot:TRINITY_DN18558_c0_g1_i1.p1 TRINITY_DN18558_c0_g1~~TRINITY_DN18558_c0_g1_i1.p1  ORF type:complete len:366 (-),score=70.92 TRINITY_DN18558_c0_g1_i1:104-1201(-)
MGLDDVVRCLKGYKQPPSLQWPGISLSQLEAMWPGCQQISEPAKDNRDDTLSPMENACFPDSLTSNGFLPTEPDQLLWQGTPVPQGLSSRCDFDVLDSISPSDFQAKYVHARKPVLIRNVSTAWAATARWRSARSLREAYPDIKMGVGFAGIEPYYGGKHMSIDQFLQFAVENVSSVDGRPGYMTDNAFDYFRHHADENRAKHPVEDTEFPAFLKELPAELLGMHFTAGGACSGTHIHAHAHGVCGLVHGMKWWGVADTRSDVFSPPEELEAFDYAPRDYLAHIKMGSGFEWWREQYPGLQECVQRAGDLVYIPESFDHVVLNIWPSVGVVHEFLTPDQADYTREMPPWIERQRNLERKLERVEL